MCRDVGSCNFSKCSKEASRIQFDAYFYHVDTDSPWRRMSECSWSSFPI